MKEALYLNGELAIVNYSRAYAHSLEQLLNSSTFSNYVQNYLEYLQAHNEDLYNYALNGKTAREATFEILKLFRLLRVFRVEELQSDYLNDKACLLEFVEEGYNFWKRHQRFSVLFNAEGSTLQDFNFVAADSNFNTMILSVYRSLEEQIQGRKNRVYRQLQAGTNASIAVRVNSHIKLSDTYAKLKAIPFIEGVMLRTPMILHPKSNKRTGMFE